MKKEFGDRGLLPEISKLPQLHVQLEQAEDMAKQEKGQENARRGTSPTLTNGNNVPGENPMPALSVASPVDPAALASLMSSRSGAAPLALWR